MTYLLTIVVAGLLVCGTFGDGGPSHEMAVSDLPQVLDTEEGIKHLHKEFASIEGGQRRPWNVASAPQNMKKNRYDDLLAFDPHRVVLHKISGDENSDYINANYIDGQHMKREYVAMQGPLPNTVNDFWRMIWQLNATKVIMLANLTEHGKVRVEKYWPNHHARYGHIEVRKLTEHSIPRLQHVIRTFSVKKHGFNHTRLLRQFHFTGWPDFGVPNDTFPVLSLIHQARLYDPESKSPIVVHCIAGIGRTGTVILMDSVIQKADAEGVVDFPKRLDHMRTLRPDLVEKKQQYVFAYEAVNSYFNDPDVRERLFEVEEEYRHLDDSHRSTIPPTDSPTSSPMTRRPSIFSRMLKVVRGDYIKSLNGSINWLKNPLHRSRVEDVRLQ